ncbi:conserved hypothetical protein [Luminiphilus syltensis NOR5-1B]|uniref:DUF4382 domain-containing protein n=1 Tax=Luminiphilus syltensis NOR5-1B TaxID=565045 RepID=B8KT54_9GAMM|nr:DUF4382 domain-containing protein [Luminiphilus syltensis]EED35090.1 conserved hypothetical protein [Luminiphilus syltensis NOR5-1B]
MRRHRTTLIPLTAAIGALMTGCGGGGGGTAPAPAPPTTGSLSLDVTDAPVDSASRVLVQFTGVSLQPSEGDPIELAITGDTQTCQQLLDGTPPSATPEGEDTVRCIDLLALQGTESSTLLQDVELDAGTYSGLRLKVDGERGVVDSAIELNDGGIESLFIPSGGESGLKLNSSFDILAGGSSRFVIDFDLRKSVNDPQGFPDYRLRPSLRLVDLSESGGIAGVVAPERLSAPECTGDINTGGGYAVYAYTSTDDTPLGEEGSDNAPLTSASIALNNEGDWSYTLGFLPPGDYRVGFTCQASEDDVDNATDGILIVPSVDNPVSVVDGEEAVANFL